MLGYIPTAQQLVEGGYESKESVKAFGYSSYFTLEVETSIHKGILELIAHMEGTT
ncbi:hypothetical protein [Paenibacillus plantarum]|uniref:hypothetical protein n=1 Tax=Paenibacillus plantarum TaxID=2654975 RepID=UPI001492344B|nr:hypothetical protein [Paenibacillus plantarum]